MKRSLVYLTLLLILLGLLISTFYLKDSYKALPINTALNEKPLPPSESWFEYDAPIGGFKVSLPLLPQTATQSITDPKTNEVREYEMYVTQTDSGTIYMISLITLPDQPDEKRKLELLKELMNDMVKANPENKLKDSKEIKFEGFPGFDFVIENDHNLIEAKGFIKENTIYLLSVISKKEDREKTHFNYFIDSFKIKAKP